MQSNDIPDTGIPYNNPTFNRRSDSIARTSFAGDGSPISVPRNTYYGTANRDFRKDQTDMGTIRFEHDFSPALKFRNQTRVARTHQTSSGPSPTTAGQHLLRHGLAPRQHARLHGQHHRQPDRPVRHRADRLRQAQVRLRHRVRAGEERERQLQRGHRQQPLPQRPGAAGATTAPRCSANPFDPWSGAISRANNPTNSKTNTAAVYLFDSVELGKHWLVNGGIRYDRYDANFTSAADSKGVRTDFGRTDNLFNYQLGIVFKPVETVSLYASFGTSSTPAGSFLTQGSDGNALGPDRSGNIGAMLAPEEPRLRSGRQVETAAAAPALTAALFRIDTTNARITLQDGTAAMAGDKRVQGFELGFSGNVTNDWAVFGGYTHLKSELRNAGGAGAAFGLASSTSFPNTPDDSFSLWTTYRCCPSSRWAAAPYYVSRSGATRSTNKWVPSYWRFDAMASYRVNKNTALQLNVQNLTDKVYYSRAYASHYATMAPGRAFIFSANVRF